MLSAEDVLCPAFGDRQTREGIPAQTQTSKTKTVFEFVNTTKGEK